MNYRDLKYVCEHAGGGLLPALANLHVYDNEAGERRMQVGNGRFTVDAPTDMPVCTVAADRAVAAWAACKTEPTATTTDVNLMVKAGRVTSRIRLGDGTAYPRTNPDPIEAHTAPGIAGMLAKLQPFVATDASRPWATSVCLKDGYAYATNNVVLCRAPFPTVLPFSVNMPLSVFDAIIDKGEPTDIGGNDRSLTFYFEDGVWIKTNLIQGDWPTHVVDGLLGSLVEEAWATPHPDLGLMLVTSAKLADARHPVVQFTGNGLKLLDEAFEADELDPVPDAGRINARMGALVFGQATDVQWHTPRQDVHAFRVGDIVGVLGGQR